MGRTTRSSKRKSDVAPPVEEPPLPPPVAQAKPKESVPEEVEDQAEKIKEQEEDGEEAMVADDEEEEESKSRSSSPDLCPGCTNTKAPKSTKSRQKDRTWVMCESCETWYHWDCVGGTGELEAVDKWYCNPCQTADPSKTITYKPPTRKSNRSTTKLDYAHLHDGGVTADPKRWARFIRTKPIKKSSFPHIKGEEFTMHWLVSNEDAMTLPLIIDDPEGLGMKMPEKSFTVSKVATVVGPKEKVEVLDVASQREDKGWTLQRWADYYNTEPDKRDKIRNVISLEISETKLAEKVQPPRLVTELDWVEQFWPSNRRKGAAQYPKVQLYCLMSVADCWTDWHVDFAGSSVYYHILKGSKVFYFIRPTPANIDAYERWSGSDVNQATVWLGDWADEVIKVELTAGNTMIVPTGWIHAVYTPSDSLVFGGNFLHSWNIPTQLRIRQLEIATGVPKKFTFPFFQKLCWYAAEKTVKDLKAKEEFSPRVLQGFDALATSLINEVHLMERSTAGPARKDAKDQVPGTIKDPGALARELRWRVRLAAGGDSGDELVTSKTKSKSGSTNGKQRTSLGPGSNKRKRSVVEAEVDATPLAPQLARFKGFTPRPWDTLQRRSLAADKHEDVRIPKALLETNDTLAWFEENVDGKEGEGEGEVEGEGSGLVAQRTSTVDEIIKVRRVVKNGEEHVASVERERVTRVFEVWTLPPPQPPSPAGEPDIGTTTTTTTTTTTATAEPVTDGDIEMADGKTEEADQEQSEIPLASETAPVDTPMDHDAIEKPEDAPLADSDIVTTILTNGPSEVAAEDEAMPLVPPEGGS